MGTLGHLPPTLRGGGLGRRILDAFIRQAGQPIVLEVEPPTTDIAARRIGFYRRCGFRLWEHRTYMQPPYAADLRRSPLLLMVHGDLDEEKDFERICTKSIRKCTDGREASWNPNHPTNKSGAAESFRRTGFPCRHPVFPGQSVSILFNKSDFPSLISFNINSPNNVFCQANHARVKFLGRSYGKTRA